MARGEINPTLQSIEGMVGPRKRSDDSLALKAYEQLSKKKLTIDKKLEKELSKFRNGELLDFEKSKESRRKKEHDEKLKLLRIEYDLEADLDKKKEIRSKIQHEKRKQRIKENLASITKQIAGSLSKSFDSAASGINQYLGAYSQYMTGIEARIQGSGKSFSSMSKMISTNLAGSPYVSQTKMLENLNNLISQGIAYNVEQRAFLQTVSDKMVTTFDALDTNLREIIKIQQADSTAARLGMEAELTQFLNANFGDTSYLNSLFDSVAGALLGTSSQLGRDRSVEFEYIVQKWLGSLSSVGVSDATISSLAKGLNYLGTGDISGLSSDESLQRLLLMGAQTAGLDYSSILTGGLTSSDANKLLKGIISYTQSIASTGNQVVKSQYAQLFGLTISDMTSVLNLSSSDLVDISKNMLKYSEAVQETTNQLLQIPERMTLKDKIDTMFENVMAGMGENIANNAATYTTWLLNEMIMSSTGGGIEAQIPIPFVGVSTINLNKIVSAGIVGLSALSEVSTILGGLTSRTFGGLSTDIWNASDTVRKNAGWGFTGISTTGTRTTTSRAQYIGSSDSDTLLNESILGETSTETVTSSESASEQERQNIIDSIDNSKNIGTIMETLNDINSKLSIWESTNYRVTTDVFLGM